MGMRMVCVLLMIPAALGLAPGVVLAEPYSGVASVLDLGAGARPLAMGGAFVGLADDGHALMFNPAGLGGLRALGVMSSGEVRPGFGVLGQVGLVLPSLGVALHYFDFGEITKTDEYGNETGSFSYRTYTVIVGGGVRAGMLGLGAIPVLRDLGVGVKAKYHVVRTLEPGSGSGLAMDLCFHYTTGRIGRGAGLLTGFGVGLVMENLVGIPLEYGSGHLEEWPKGTTFGASTALFNTLTLVADVATGRGVRFGLEWLPVPVLAVRLGLRSEGVLMWSLGLGVRYSVFAIDYAVVLHPYLSPQHRVSFGIDLFRR